MKVVFRASASIEIGTGHVMRCLTLADALREQGAETLFLCQPTPGHLGALIEERGHRIHWLPASDSQAADGGHCKTALSGQGAWDWLVVDHYTLDAAWESALRSVCKRIMVIDDLANRPHDCDLLLDQNLQEPGRYTALVPAAATLLLGPKYALLRPQFAAARQTLAERDGKVRRLLVFCGGADATGETLKALAAIEKLARTDLAVDVVIGAANPHRAAIEKACRERAGTTLYCQVTDMAAHMAAADLFVGVGGTSSWERCCMGLPAVVWASAENQVAQSEALAIFGAHLYLGSLPSDIEAKLAPILDDLFKRPSLLMQMSQLAKDLVDGFGAGRVAKMMQL